MRYWLLLGVIVGALFGTYVCMSLGIFQGEIMTMKDVLEKRPCCKCKHYQSCSVRTGAYIPCKDSSHEHFELDTDTENNTEE